MSGRLIALEGADASGKSTQARRLAEALGAVSTFQFGATAIGAAVRNILLDPANIALDDRAEALLIIADKAQHVAEIVNPALRSGRDVVTDRFTASTVAYQGFGRGLDAGRLREMMRFATGGLEPDLTVLLDIDTDVALARLGTAVDRIEASGREFHERVRRGYLQLAASQPLSWLVVDGSGSIDKVGDRVLSAVQGWLARETE